MNQTDSKASGSRAVPISHTECLRLLQYGSFLGRIAFAVEQRVEMRPVNYIADDSGVAFCTASSMILRAVTAGLPALFEVDATRPLDHAGWSVIVHGSVREVTDSEELDYLRRGPLKSWAVSPRERWIRLAIDEISGMRVPSH